MRAKIDTNDAKALIQVRMDLKDGLEAAAKAWRKRWAGSISVDHLFALELITYQELNAGAFFILLEEASGLDVKLKGAGFSLDETG